MNPRRALALLTSAALAAGVVGALTPAPATADPASSTITVFLKAPDPAELEQLAQAQGLPRAERLAELKNLVPSAATHSQIAQQLRLRGYSVVAQTAWSITAVGAQSTTTSLFGSRPTASADSSPRRFRAATGALPRIPAALSHAVAAVFPTNTGPQVYHHATSTLNGSAFRNAYTAANTTPSTGGNDSPATVATVQFANFFDSSYAAGNFQRSVKAKDLTQYALRHGLPDPVASGQYKAVKVGGGPSACDDGKGGEALGCPGGGDIEVNLDQQSILSTAPSAKQQAYFGPNTNAGYNNAFAAVYDDAVGNKYATAPNSHIVALSTSWGQCESLTDYSGIKSLEPILQSLVAAGVTVFSAAGDYGIYDCGYDPNDNTADVDYPGTSPSVISVGGSYLSAPSNQPNTGRNWTESAWSCKGPYDCQAGNGGTGGGQSGEAYAPGDPDAFGGFPAPAWQTAAIDTPLFKNDPKRLVPDITADGSWRTGLAIYTSDTAACGCDNNTAVIGGTSLGSPVSAALLTNALGDAGRTTGVGDVHGALYSAYRRTHTLKNTDPAKVVRDITSGQNGNRADRSTDPSVFAHPGFDTVSGVGSVYWSALMPYILDKHTPVVTAAKFGEQHPYGDQWRHVTASWSVGRGSDLRLVGPTHVVVHRLGAANPTVDYYVWPASNSRDYVGLPGSTYRLTVQARDIGRHQSAATTRLVQVPKDDSWFDYGSKWLRVSRAGDIAGTHLNAYTRGAYAKASGYGSSYKLRVVVGPDAGRLAVAAGGTRVAVFNLYAAKRGVKTFDLPVRMKGRMSRMFTFTDLGNKRVSLDALWVNY